MPARAVGGPVAARGNGQAAADAEARTLRRQLGNATGGKKGEREREGTRLHSGLLRVDVSLEAAADLVRSTATCTRTPSRRSSGGLMTTTLVSASPPVT